MEPKFPSDAILRFGVFELDLRSNELRKHGVRVKVQDAPLRALRLFLSRPNEILSRQDFRKVLWADGVFVDFDRAINSTINRLRETLGDVSSNPVFIETVARFGYRWIASVHAVPAAAEAIVRAEIPALEAEPKRATPTVLQKSRAAWLWAVATAVLLFAGALLVVGWTHGRRSPGAATSSPNSTHPAAPWAKPPDPEAEKLYLSGRYYWNKRTPEGLQQAQDFFTQAIVRDPSYAKAYVGLADTYDLMREFSAMPDDEAYPRAYAAASKAVELDDSSAEAHATLGFLSFWWKRDGKAADREFRRTIALNPAYVDAYRWYANILGCQGRGVESLDYLRRAQQLDPASSSILADKAGAMLLWGPREEGITVLKQIETTDPRFASPHLYLSQLYLSELDGRDYLIEARATSRLRARASDMLVIRAAEKGFAEGGTAGMLRSMLAVQQKLHAEGHLSAYQVARTEALLGHRAAALGYLHIALQHNETELATMRADLSLADLHKLPEFQQILMQAGLPPFS